MIRLWDKSRPPRGPFALNADAPQAQGLVAWWPMAGASGPQYVPDVVRNAFPFDAGVRPSVSAGELGEPCFDFNGSTQYFEQARLPASAPPLTVAGWIMPRDVTTNKGIACLHTTSGTTSDRLQFDVNAGSLRWIAVDLFVNAGVASQTIVANRWQHVAGVEVSASSRYAYVNGSPGAQDTTSVAYSLAGGAYTTLGALNIDLLYGLSGLFGEFGMWNRALPSEIVRRLADPGLRFELWYPLRSKKWISTPSGAVVPYWAFARNRSGVIGAGRGF